MGVLVDSTVLLSVTVVLSVGYGGLAPVHIWLLGGQVILCPCHWYIVWSDIHTSVPPAYCNYIWLLPDPQSMEDIMFILRVGVVYSCSLYHI